MKRKIAAVALCAASLTGGSVLAIESPASADSRCNRNNHTHGAAWWKRTDNYLSRWRYTDGYGKTYAMYHHTNSNPVSGCANY